MTLSLRNGRKYVKFWFQVLSEVHDGGDIAAAVAVIGSAPDGDDGLVFKVPLHAGLATVELIGMERGVPYSPH